MKLSSIGLPVLCLGLFSTAVGQEPPTTAPSTPVEAELPDPVPPGATLDSILDGSAFVKIPAGEFLMGSGEGNADEQPVHLVRISQPFLMTKFEVTQSQWVSIMLDPHAKVPAKPSTRGRAAPASHTAAKQTPADVNPSHFKGLARPVESVAWPLVQEFIRRLNERDSKHTYRLPTEAEWEYAARAGARGDSVADLAKGTWNDTNSNGMTQPVGRKAPNAWGLYDMAGNVHEWVEDWYAPAYVAESRPVVDPTGPSMGSYRVFRGCSWLSAPTHCRHAFRFFDFPNEGSYAVGFRLVRTNR